MSLEECEKFDVAHRHLTTRLQDVKTWLIRPILSAFSSHMYFGILFARIIEEVGRTSSDKCV
jgi:hypothetical protein